MNHFRKEGAKLMVDAQKTGVEIFEIRR